MENSKLNLELSKIIQTPLKTNQLMSGEYDKKQIVFHHTVSGDFPKNVASWWNRTKPRIATAILIGHNGVAYQCFSSKKWAHHIGCPSSFLKAQGFSDYETRNILLNKESIGIEMCSWGGLVKKNGKWYNVYDKEIDSNNVQIYENGYRGYYGFEKYTDKQIEKCLELCYYWHKYYGIPVHYNEDMWEINKRALSSEKGIWTHNSYRTDKSDCHPQPELIEGLKYLENFVYNGGTSNEKKKTIELILEEKLTKLFKTKNEIDKILQKFPNDFTEYNLILKDLNKIF